MNEQIIIRYISNIGKNVRKIRKQELNKTQEEFAEMIDMCKDTVSNIERCQVVTTIEGSSPEGSEKVAKNKRSTKQP